MGKFGISHISQSRHFFVFLNGCNFALRAQICMRLRFLDVECWGQFFGKKNFSIWPGFFLARSPKLGPGLR